MNITLAGNVTMVCLPVASHCQCGGGGAMRTTPPAKMRRTNVNGGCTMYSHVAVVGNGQQLNKLSCSHLVNLNIHTCTL